MPQRDVTLTMSEVQLLRILIRMAHPRDQARLEEVDAKLRAAVEDMGGAA